MMSDARGPRMSGCAFAALLVIIGSTAITIAIWWAVDYVNDMERAFKERETKCAAAGGELVDLGRDHICVSQDGRIIRALAALNKQETTA